MSQKDELDSRLAKADPAQRRPAPTLTEGVIAKAISGSNKLSLRSRFELLGQNFRRLALGLGVASSAAVVAVALVITSTPQPLIQLSGMQGARNNESAAAQMDVGSDKMMMPFNYFEFLAGPNLSDEPGKGQVYKLVRQSTPEEVLKNVAAVLGVSGSIKKYPDFAEGNPGYFFGQSDDPWGYDSKNAVISLWWLGTASWNYSNPIAFPDSVCEETDEAGNCVAYQQFQPTPELLPTEAEAVAKALEVFNATGLQVSASDIRVEISEWGVNASASMSVGGQPTNLEWYLGWSSTGEISYAGGHSVAAESMGTFDTVSALAAVDRLSDWRWSGSPSGIFYQRFQSTVSIEPAPYVRDNAAGVSEGSEPGSAGDSSIGDEPMPGPMPEPQTLTLTILESESALLSVWDANGEVWLVPGWILINDQGWFGAVISVIEGVIELPKETDFNIMPLPADDSVSKK
jgi:hypothetical protein